MRQVYLLLGSNLNNPRLQLEIALQKIEEKAGKAVCCSKIYRSSPWGLNDQPEFANQVIEIDTSFSPQDLLSCLQSIEIEMGRERIIKWGSRIIDIDILYYAGEILSTTALKIPHPEIQGRRFTLVPLCDIAPDLIHPVWNISNQEMLNRCQDEGSVVIIT